MGNLNRPIVESLDEQLKLVVKYETSSWRILKFFIFGYLFKKDWFQFIIFCLSIVGIFFLAFGSISFF
jgi:hypothetical protein